MEAGCFVPAQLLKGPLRRETGEHIGDTSLVVFTEDQVCPPDLIPANLAEEQRLHFYITELIPKYCPEQRAVTGITDCDHSKETQDLFDCGI